MRRLLWLVLLGGCFEADVTVCGDRACPATLACTPAGDDCAPQPDIEACANLADATPCTRLAGPGVCRAQVCIEPGCGNAVTEPGEACDDGNVASFDGCSGNCLSAETCGDGVIDRAIGEVCDCGSAGAVSQSCDGPNDDAPGGECRLDCLPARCGDAVEDPGEACDDGNATSFDGCAAGCDSRFSPTATTSAGSFKDVIAFAGGEAVAVDEIGIYRFDGVTWHVLRADGTAFTAVWGVSPTDFYVAGSSGFFHFDGATWTLLGTTVGGYIVQELWGSPVGVIGVGSSGFTGPDGPAVYAYAIGSAGFVPAYLWCSDSDTQLVSITGTDDDVFIAATSGEVCRYDSTGAAHLLAPPPGNTSGPVRLDANGDEVVMLTDQGAFRLTSEDSWQSLGLLAGRSAHAITIAGPGHYFVSGATGLVLEYRDSTWRRTPTSVAVNLDAIDATSATNVFIVGGTGIALH